MFRKFTFKALINFLLLSLIFSVTGVVSVRAAGILFVVEDGIGDCSSWANACSLQTALTTSISGDEIWVAVGTYKPTTGTDRNATFLLKDGVSIYGGFNGTETLRDERDLATNVTILSGDLNSDDIGFTNNSENVYHVVTGADGAVLDGVTVMAGNAVDSSGDSSGGGILLYSGTLTIANSIISRNSATYGGGIFNSSGTLNITESTFSNNQAISFYTSCGGGIFNTGILTITKSVFSGNIADVGGGIYHQNGILSISNSTFSNNTADSGGGLENFSPQLTTITNSSFIGNSATYNGSSIYNNGKSLLTIMSNTFSGDSTGHGSIYNYEGTLNVYNNIFANSGNGDCVNIVGIINASNNLIEDAASACGMNNGVNGNIIGSDPGFGTLTGSPAYFPLNNGSLAIDKGDNAKCPATDQRGMARPQGSHCDIGAYEFIDPSLIWNTFLGGNGSDVGNDITIDDSGNIYVTGYSAETWGSPVRAYSGDYDAFVAKFDSSGALIWNTFLGSQLGRDIGNGITLDGNGNVYVTGIAGATWGTPVTGHSGFYYDAFVVKLNSSGAVIWNTFIGGSGDDYGNHIAVDVNGNIYIAGDSHNVAGTDDNGFASKINSSGVFQWTTVLGGGWVDGATDIAVDGNQNVYVLGNSITTWGDNPLRSFSNGSDAFVAKLNSLDGALSWHTFLGGDGYDRGNSIFLDESGNIYVAGESNASWETPVRAYSGGGDEDAFAVKLDSSGSMIWNTFLGGINYDIGTGIAVDKDYSVYLSGISYDTWDNPLMAYSGGGDGFAVKLNSLGVLTSNTFLGGNGHNHNGEISAFDSGFSVTVDQSGYAYVTGMSYDTWGSPISAFTGSNDGFVAKVKLATFADVSSTYWSWNFIERLYNAGITGGCSLVPLMYCPENTVTRAQMAVFLLRGIHGSSYVPPSVGAGTGFADVPTNHPVAAWIKQLAAEGITGGCGNSNYCPDATVTRAQMAVFLLRSKYTSAYTPPSANGDFTDVPLDHSMVAWIEQLAAEGITGGCGVGVYCPDGNVTRAQMAVFLVRTFNLP